MKNKFLIILFSLFFFEYSIAEELSILAKNITIDKKNETTIFENQVIVTTKDKSIIKGEYAEYNKIKGTLLIKKNVTATDYKNNTIKTEYAFYNDKTKLFESLGPTQVITTENYIIEGENILFDNLNKIISSKKKTKITDTDKNLIYLENFEYKTDSNIFKSIGFVEIKDKFDNSYEFSQIYIDTKKKEVLGTDIKSFLNDKNFKINENNKPRIFSNTLKMDGEKTSFNKSIFTMCNYRKNDKCPPWSIQARKMLHDNNKKTIYYDHAVVKVYNIPIFYTPKLSHPDPSVDRRSGFLPPSLSNSKNLGTGISLPYFWAVDHDKNLTFTNKFYVTENPLFLGEFHQAFKYSQLFTDFGFTEGYKKTSSTKKPGNKTHFFSKFVKNFENVDNSKSTFSFATQNVSNNKYLKLYKINSNLVDYNTDNLENSIDFTHEKNDMFFGLNASIFETLDDKYDDKYEYILPEITLDKNLFSNNRLGNLDLQSNYKVHNYDTNKFTNFLVNDLNWSFRDINFSNGIKSKILGSIKNLNYETRNVDIFKQDTTSELFGALGYLSEIEFQKNVSDNRQSLKPKFLLRYAPGSMRKESSGARLNPINAFTLNRVESSNNFETGLNATIGVDYKIKSQSKEFDFSLAQIINDQENKKMAQKTSLDEKISDLVGSANYKINENINFNYNFALDQNYNDFNYNEFGSTLDFDSFKVDFNYLQEGKHIGDKEYFTTKLNFNKSKSSLISLETKRNLITNSSEFYNLSYEYLNDCLKAGLVYRREFYNDSELEPENSLMFKITLIPFGDINSPAFNK